MRHAVAGDTTTTATFSPDRRHRYLVERRWDGRPLGTPSGLCAFVGMNPSTGDETHDDPTMAGCSARARDWGFGGFVMLNAFAYRATDKARLLEVDDPVGPENDATILAHAARADRLIVAWGQPPRPLAGRGPRLAALLAEAGLRPLCFAVNRDGSPKHPLYVARRAPLVAYPLPPSAIAPPG